LTFALQSLTQTAVSVGRLEDFGTISHTIVTEAEFATTSDCVLRRWLHDIGRFAVLLQGTSGVA
jgi:hypothetical protein